MAKCDLSVELDDSDRIYPGGGQITGVVRVECDTEVTCNGLEVRSVWKTHGRGNVDQGGVATETLYTGQWMAGERHEYRFTLPIADWPPSYHGHYINVDHYVEAQAKIPWAFDPKASAPFLMRPTCGPEGAKVEKNVTELKGVAGCLLGLFFLLICGGMFAAFAAAMAAQPFFLLIIGGVIGISGLFVFFKYFLPKYLLGDVQCALRQDTASPGDVVDGELLIRPRKNVSINGVTLRFQGSEKAVSGSGSNRKTHSHTFIDRTDTLQEATQLRAGAENRLPITIRVPDDAPYTIDLSDNDIVWTADIRIDIPRWPDWNKQLKLAVVPDGEPPAAAAAGAAAETDSTGSGGGDITFAETARHFWDVRNDRDQVETLAGAVIGLTFPMEAFVERRLLYSGDEDPHVHEDGYAVWAHYTDPPLPMVLYVPHDLADEFEQIGRDLWRGRGTIVGWDGQHRRLQVKLDAESGPGSHP